MLLIHPPEGLEIVPTIRLYEVLLWVGLSLDLVNIVLKVDALLFYFLFLKVFLYVFLLLSTEIRQL